MRIPKTALGDKDVLNMLFSILAQPIESVNYPIQK
jgi:hypothetical protein